MSDDSERIADQIQRAVEVEREECAKLCDMAQSDERYPVEVRSLAAVLARHIRRRGTTP